MIKANELRIGNSVELFSVGMNEWEKVQLKAQHILNIDKNVTDSKPIPLTLEVLKKYSFEEDEGTFYRTVGRKTIGVSFEDSIEVTYEPNIGMTFSNLNVDIEYLHQFQNIFFFLMDAELTENNVE